MNNKKKNNNRRSFIARSTLGTGGMFAGLSKSKNVSAGVRSNPKIRSSLDLLKAGIIFNGSGHGFSSWPAAINAENRTRHTKMVVTHGWSFRRKYRDAFKERFGCAVVNNFDDMIGKIDCLLVDDFWAVSWYHKLLQPFIEANIPIVVDRPFSTSRPKAKFILDLAKKHNTPITTGTSYEYPKEAAMARQYVKEIGGDIRGYCAHTYMTDFYSHGIHGINWAHRILCQGIEDGRVLTASYKTTNWHRPNGIVTLKHEGRNGGKSFYGVIQLNQPYDAWAWIKIYGDGQPYEQWYRRGRKGWDDDYIHCPEVFLVDQKMIETGKMPESYEDILIKFTVFLGAFKSHRLHNGDPVALAEVGDWDAGPPPKLYSGDRFYYTNEEAKEWEKLF